MESKQQHILYLSANDSREIFRRQNTNAEFVVDLGKPLELRGIWRIQLLSFRCDAVQSDNRNIFVCCDLCESSFVRDKYLPVLTNIYLDGEDPTIEVKGADPTEDVTSIFTGKKIERVFDNPPSFKVIQHCFQRVRVYLRDANLDTPSLLPQRTEVTLRIFKVNENESTTSI